MSKVVHSNRHIERLRSPSFLLGGDGKVRLYYVFFSVFLVWFYSLSNDWVYFSIIAVWIVFYKKHLEIELKPQDTNMRDAILDESRIQDAALSKYKKIIDAGLKTAKILFQNPRFFIAAKTLYKLFKKIVISTIKLKRGIIDINLSSKLLPTPLLARA